MNNFNLNYDSSKHYLGKLCPHNHEYEESGQSLRALGKRKPGACVICRRIGVKKSAQKKIDAVQKDNFCDSERGKYLLGTLCCKGHKWREFNCSLRFVKKMGYPGDCLECGRLKSEESRRRNPEARRAIQRRYREKNKDVLRERGKIYRTQNAERIREKYKRRDPKKRLLEVHRRLAQKRRVHNNPYKYEDVLARYAEFDNRCAYCGDLKKLTIEHFIPIAKGGSNAIGNIIPACLQCNCSKSCTDPKEWYERQSFYSKRRWNKILKILGKSGTNYNQLSLL